ISAWERPAYFVDEQVAGPFRRWRHEHRFEAAPGATRMTDVVDFSAPAGPLGTIADVLVLRRYLTGLIRLRNDHLRAATEARP
ncbi:MAG: SRPBCC family protein, partial [Nonomuraea sp.]|nr:SRPBCC family protein [Nonomuraea sp.]NUS07347.1 SRPBCC family protein [Nonomuraea sp.]